MLLTLLYCVTIAWAPGTGTPTGYTVRLDGIIHHGVNTNQASLCLNDQEPHTVTVEAFDDDGNTSPMSNESDVIRMEIKPPFYTEDLPAVVRADLDGSGVVGYGDFNEFSKAFARCNDGRQEVSCP